MGQCCSGAQPRSMTVLPLMPVPPLLVPGWSAGGAGLAGTGAADGVIDGAAEPGPAAEADGVGRAPAVHPARSPSAVAVSVRASQRRACTWVGRTRTPSGSG